MPAPMARRSCNSCARVLRRSHVGLRLLMLSLLSLLSFSSAFSLLPLHPRTTPAQRCEHVRCGFEVQSLSEKDVEELNVMNWPGLEKRTVQFEQMAEAEELKMVYVKQGSAVVQDAEEEAAVGAGQVVMISDGAVTWKSISEEGLVLMSTTTSLNDDTAAAGAAAPGEDKDVSAKEAAAMLAAGFVFGGVIALSVNLIGVLN